MTLSSFATQLNGSNLLYQLVELIKKQGFYIGQEAFYKTSYHKEKVRISGYLFVIENNQLQLRYLTEATESIKQVLEGVFDEPDESIIGIDDLICPRVHQPMCLTHHSGVAVNKLPLQAMNKRVQKS